MQSAVRYLTQGWIFYWRNRFLWRSVLRPFVLFYGDGHSVQWRHGLTH